MLMDEKRKFFRIKNNGEFEARINTQALEVIDISAASVCIVTCPCLAENGSLVVKVKKVVLKMDYEILRIVDDRTVLIFNNESQVNELFQTLKQLRAGLL